MFEVIAPENTTPGETINIIVAKVKYDDLNSIVEASASAAIEAGKQINEKYDIVNRATAAFDNAKANFAMNSDDNTSDMHLGFDLFTHLDAGGATVLFGMGFGYDSWTCDTCIGVAASDDFAAATSTAS